jgi:RNA-directed DNA polymerase
MADNLVVKVHYGELDGERERRGHKFVRYADDLVILCRSRRRANRVLKSIISFIEGKLFLKVNGNKSQVAHIKKIKFLGYSFYQYKGEGKLRLHPKRGHKLKAKIKELTSRSNGWGHARRKEALRQYIIGWVHYFKLADMDTLLVRVDEWYRRRLRMIIWKTWKRVRTRLSNLLKLWVSKAKAWEWANTRKGLWHVAKSYILHTTITRDRLQLAGYVFLSDYYRNVRVVN